MFTKVNKYPEKLSELPTSILATLCEVQVPESFCCCKFQNNLLLQIHQTLPSILANCGLFSAAASIGTTNCDKNYQPWPQRHDTIVQSCCSNPSTSVWNHEMIKTTNWGTQTDASHVVVSESVIALQMAFEALLGECSVAFWTDVFITATPCFVSLTHFFDSLNDKSKFQCTL